MNKLAYATIAQLKSMLEKNEITQKEVLDNCLQRFAKYNPILNCAIQLFDADSILQECIIQGPLAGIPGIFKDNIAQKDRRLSCASKILDGYTVMYDSTASARAKQAGGLLVGRANLDEFAMGSSTETSYFGKTKNPWDTKRVPGGSSGGSAAAVAAGLVPWALGSDTGGSVRQPAAFCGIVGIKPTYGLVSRYGLVAYGSSLDQIGVFSRTIQDNARVLSVIAGHDMRDSTSLRVGKKDYTQNLKDASGKGLRIGVVENALYAEGMDPEIVQSIEQAIAVYEKMGATIQKIKLTSFDYAAAAYFIISRAEAASNLARFDGVRYAFRAKDAKTLYDMYCDTRHDGFGNEVKNRILVGNYVLSAGHAGAFYNNATLVRRMIRAELQKAFKSVDVLIMPTHPMPAFEIGAFDKNKLQMDLQDYFTCPMNLSGNPAISIPCGFTKQNLPIGMQLIGPHLSEELLYKTAYVYEQETKWFEKKPKGFE